MLDVTSLPEFTDAQAASADCEWCYGCGLATIFHGVEYDGTPLVKAFDSRGREVRRVTRGPAYCVCTAGRWLMFNHEHTCKSVYQRVPDLHDVIEWEKHGSFWSTTDPTLAGYTGPVLGSQAEVRAVCKRPPAGGWNLDGPIEININHSKPSEPSGYLKQENSRC